MFIQPPENDPLEEQKRRLIERLLASQSGRGRNVAGGQRLNRGRTRGLNIAALMSGGMAGGRFNRPFGMGGVHPGARGLDVAGLMGNPQAPANPFGNQPTPGPFNLSGDMVEEDSPLWEPPLSNGTLFQIGQGNFQPYGGASRSNLFRYGGFGAS